MFCSFPHGHLQATGRDVRGRKQYRYHPRWRAVGDETKYDRMLMFCQVLPKLRERFEQHLQLPDLSREKILATVTERQRLLSKPPGDYAYRCW
jgi:DNA topoisomerase-1